MKKILLLLTLLMFLPLFGKSPRCQNCGREYSAAALPAPCPNCGAEQAEVLSGTEAYLENIEFTLKGASE